MAKSRAQRQFFKHFRTTKVLVMATILSQAPGVYASGGDACGELFKPLSAKQIKEVKALQLTQDLLNTIGRQSKSMPQMYDVVSRQSEKELRAKSIVNKETLSEMSEDHHISLNILKKSMELFRPTDLQGDLDYPHQPNNYALSSILALPGGQFLFTPNLESGVISAKFGSGPFLAQMTSEGSWVNIHPVFKNSNSAQLINDLERHLQNYTVSLDAEKKVLIFTVSQRYKNPGYPNKDYPDINEKADVLSVDIRTGKELQSLSQKMNSKLDLVVDLGQDHYLIAPSRSGKMSQYSREFMLVNFRAADGLFRIRSRFVFQGKPMLELFQAMKDKKDLSVAQLFHNEHEFIIAMQRYRLRGGVVEDEYGLGLDSEPMKVVLEPVQGGIHARNGSESGANNGHVGEYGVNTNRIKLRSLKGDQFKNAIMYSVTEFLVNKDTHAKEKFLTNTYLLLKGGDGKVIREWSLADYGVQGEVLPVAHRVSKGWIMQLNHRIRDPKKPTRSFDLKTILLIKDTGEAIKITDDETPTIGAFDVKGDSLYFIGPDGQNLNTWDLRQWF